MCGIAGILNLAPAEPPDEPTLRQMLAMIRHRGPDQFGIYLADTVGLGNARLSIIDLGGGQQPICNEDESLWIVFNGEIFNYVELRAELEARGHRFATHSDTEVILHLYEDYGPDALPRLNGQWAIAIWDERQRTLLLSRDRLGVRPLFHTRAGNRLVFGSEIKALLAVPGVTAELDPVTLAQVFTYWSALSPRTAFRGIQEVPPGHYLLARDGTFTIHPYWQLDFPPSSELRPATPHLPSAISYLLSALPPPSSDSPAPSSQLPAPYLDAFRELLTDATRIRLRADVPVGAYLSGGLDSSTIAAVIQRLGVSHLDTFSIAFSDSQFDESEFQRRMAQFLGTDHQVVYATHADIGRVFPEVVWHAEIPLLRTAPAPMFLLSRLVRSRNYKVVLTGEGADEFLGGYDIFKEAKVRRFWARQPESAWRPWLLRRLYPDIAGLAGTNPAYLKAFFGEGLGDLDSPSYSHAVRWRNNRRTQRFFSDALRAAIADEATPEALVPSFAPSSASWEPLARDQFVEITVFLSQYLLSSQGDRMAMANSVEGRYPFLDYRVVEFCNRLPANLKLRGLTEKYLLRKVAEPWLPPEIWERRKRPYRAPIHRSFFNDRTEPYVEELLSPGAVGEKGLFKPAAVRQLVEKIQSGAKIGETDDMALAGILSTQLLHEHFIRRFRREASLPPGADVKVCRRGSAATRR